MPFVGTTTGGAWPSSGTTVLNCGDRERMAIEEALRVVLDPVLLADIHGRGGELTRLAELLGAKNLDNINLDCNGSECTDSKNAYSEFGGNTTTFCSGGLPPRTSQQATNSTMFHELVHQCGGAELDAWSLEQTFFSGRGFNRGPGRSYCVSPGTGWPRADTMGLRFGTFVVWNPATGEVFAKTLSGGGWPSSPTPAPGNRLLGPDPWWQCDPTADL